MQEAIDAFRAGDKGRAFVLLRRYLATNPRDVTAWLWISDAAPEPQMQIDALERALELAPEHQYAEVIRERIRILSAARPETYMGDTPTAPELTATAPAPADEPSADEILAQLRGESLRARTEDEMVAPAGDLAEDEELLDEDLEPVWAAPEETAETRSGGAQVYTYDGTVETDQVTPGTHSDMAEPILLDDEEAVGAAMREEMDDTRDSVMTTEARRPARQGIPAWVWLVTLLFLILVAAFLYFVFVTSTGTVVP
ncbi:MAG: hypothetical protein ACRDIB_02505 [Ardenticatenaceae bacterium]